MSQGRLCFHSGPPRWACGAWTWTPLHLIDKPVLLCVFLSLITDSEDDGESEAAKQLIQPIAEKIIAKYKAKEEEAPLLFFVAGEVSAAGAPRAGSSRCVLRGRVLPLRLGRSRSRRRRLFPLRISGPV